MNDRATLRKLMIAAGLLAALTIAVSPAFQQEAASIMMEIKADADSADEGPKLSTVSADALTSSQAVEVESANPFTIQEIISTEEHPSPVSIPVVILGTTLKTLLRSVISPQAP